MKPTVLLGVRVWLIPGVDDGARAGRGAGDALPDVVSPLAEAVGRPAGCGGDLAGATGDLTADQERNQDVGQPLKLSRSSDQVVLVAAVGVAGRVGVVLEDVDLAGNTLVTNPLLGVGDKSLDNALSSFVMGDQLSDVVTFGCRVLGVAAHVKIQPGAVGEKHI